MRRRRIHPIRRRRPIHRPHLHRRPWLFRWGCALPFILSALALMMILLFGLI